MLETIDGKRIKSLPHRGDFDLLVKRLGAIKTQAIQSYLDNIIDTYPPDSKTGLRTINASYLGSSLSPWPEPLVQLYYESRKLLGPNAEEKEVQNHAGLRFGLFLWERMMRRSEQWTFYDQNLSVTDPNKNPTGKVYFENNPKQTQKNVAPQATNK